MATIQNLPSLTTATGSMVFPIVDVNVNPNVTKKATLDTFADYITYIAPIGYTGSKGYAGSIGYVGSVGVGYTGSASTVAGYIGSQGFVGSVGVGYTGSASTVPGFVGSAGAGYAGSQGPQGPAGGYTGSQGETLTAKGTTSTSSLLPNPYLGNSGDSYFVADTTHLWVWDGSSWVDNGKIQGDIGYTGSASTVAGYVGSQGFVGSIGVGYTGSASTVAGYVGSQGFVGSIGFVGSAGVGYTGSQANDGGTVSNPVIITATTASINTTTGALIVSGGVGVGGDTNVGGAISASGFISSGPNNTYDLDVSGTVANYAPGDTVTFTGFSGMIIVNNWGPGAVGMFVVGGSGVQQIGTSSNGSSVGSITFSGGAYVWTNTSGSTNQFSFALIRTRNGA